MARQRRDSFVDQLTALKLESLGVPVYWEGAPGRRPDREPGTRTGKGDGYWSGNRPKSAAESLMSRVTDAVGAVILGFTRRSIDPRTLDSVDQAEAYDETVENWFGRSVEYNVQTVRDARLTGKLSEVDRDRAADPVSAGVVFGALHMPAVAAHLSDKLGYIATNSEWLTVAHGES
jgi:hypothetical protein